MYEEEKNIQLFFDVLNKSGIDYVLIKNIGNELPRELSVGKDIDILVNQADKEKFVTMMKTIARRINHPYSSYNGWENLYGLPEFEFWRLFNGQDLIADVTYQLCCMSLMPKTWLPLDKLIQENAWKNKKWDNDLSCWIMDDNTSYVYYLARCVFDKKIFSHRYIMELTRLEDTVDEELTEQMLRLIFFNFTTALKKMIKEKRFDEIRAAYLSFSDY